MTYAVATYWTDGHRRVFTIKSPLFETEDEAWQFQRSQPWRGQHVVRVVMGRVE